MAASGGDEGVGIVGDGCIGDGGGRGDGVGDRVEVGVNCGDGGGAMLSGGVTLSLDVACSPETCAESPGIDRMLSSLSS